MVAGVRQPLPDVSYPLVLDDGPEGSPMRPILGVLVGVVSFALLVPLIAQLVLMLTWVLRGQPPFDEYRASALAYVLPEGLVASHLALGSLLVVAVLLVRLLHGRNPEFLASVQPGMRWRYLLICLVVALVVINGVLWISFLVLERPAFQPAQPGWWTFLAAILLFAPLQAAAEEFFFRGYVLQAFGSAFRNPWVGIFASAVLFAMFHGTQNPALFAHRLGFGLLAGWLVWRTGGLEAAIAAHIVNNLFAFGYGIFTGGIAATKAVTEVGWDKAAFDILGFGLFVACAWWVGRRMNVATTTPSR